MYSRLIRLSRGIVQGLDASRLNYIFLLAGSGITVIISFIVMKVIKFHLGQEEFEITVLLLRYSGFIVPALCCGMGVAIPRYMGARIEKGSNDEIAAVVGTGYITILIAALCFISLISISYIKTELNRVLFDNGNYTLILGIYSCFLAFYAVAYAVARGAQHFGRNEILNLLIIGFPSIVVAYFVGSIEEYFISIATLNLILAIIITKKYYKWIRPIFSFEIFTFGAKRIFGDLIFPLLTLLPTVAIVHAVGTSKGAEFGFNIMLANGALIVLNPISTLLLPQSVKLSSNKIFLSKLIGYSIKILILAPPIIFLLILFVSQMFFSNNNILITTIVAIGGGFLSLYLLARSIIDGAYHQPRLQRIMVLALIAECLIVALAYIYTVPSLSIYAYMIGMIVLGTISLLELKRLEKNAH